MAATALNRPGQDNAAGDAFVNLKMIFSGLIAHQYQPGLKIAPKIVNRGFPKAAKSLELKYHDEESVVYHTPGEDLFTDGAYSGNPQKGSREVKLDKKLIKAGLLDDVDSLMEDFDSQKEHARAIREALQRKDEQMSLRAILAAANRNGGADEYTNEPDLGAASGIVSIVIGGAHTTAKADLLAQAIRDAATAMDKEDVPDEGRVFAIHPSYYGLLFLTTDREFINRDWGNNDNGSTAGRKIMMAGGFEVVRTSNIPTTNLAADTARQTELNLDFSNTAGAFFSKEAAVRAVAKEVGIRMWWDERLQAHAYAASLVAAYGSFRREAAIWLKGPAV